MDTMPFLARVHCITYNHAPYIIDAMNGFSMQQTDFPFVCTIIDDASTDGEPDVIKQYLEQHFDLDDESTVRNEETDDYVLTFAQHKTNKNCFFAVLYLKYNHYSIKKSKDPYIKEWMNSKYIALCEGDDYWTHPKKLQKQVDFLEANQDFVMCSHDYVYYYENQGRFKEKSFIKDYLYEKFKDDSPYYEYSLDNYFQDWFTQPLTCIYRNGEYLKSIPKNLYKFYRDDIFFYYVLKRGKGALFQDIMGVYRINDSGVWSTKNPLKRKRDSLYNAYNILKVEGDERAIFKMKRLEVEIILSQIRTFDIIGIASDVWAYWKMVPFKHFLSFVVFLLKKAILRIAK